MVRILAADLDKWLDTGMKTIQSVLLKSGKYNKEQIRQA